MLWRQFESPLILILVFAAVVAAIVQDWTNATIVLAILLASGLLGFVQEYQASNAVARLRAQVQIRSTVLRDGRPMDIPSERIVPGDIVLLAAGSLVPADGIILQSRDFFVSQSVLTGESAPVEKHPGCSPAHASLPERFNCVFMGTSVRSGTARILIVKTGAATLYGEIADELRLRPPETDFERGLRRYGYLLSQIMLALVLAVFAANVFLERPPVEALLFAMALAIGMSPELLPAIVSIALAQGAREMARRGVIVKRLNAIENFGSMNVLCTDKTGTLTRGVMALDAALDAEGEESPATLSDAFLNATLQTGLPNPLDEAIAERAARENFNAAAIRKLDEIPYDFTRKRLSIIVPSPGRKTEALIVTKGALASVLEVCDRIAMRGGIVKLDADRRSDVERLFAGWSAQGYRVLGMARAFVPLKTAYGRDDEAGLVFTGFLLFLDPPKENVREVIDAIHHLGVKLKVITGDNRLVATHLAEAVGMARPRILSGRQLAELRDEALWHLVPKTDLFVEVDPNQKEYIILALKKTGHVVGYLGDGINDAPALHAADVGISVDQAVDVAKEAADFVLLEQDLDVLRRGIEQGRATFANTLKYIGITTSANFGNMISMAIASLFLPFLPLLAKQILLNNFLSDFPAMAIAGDNVDPEMTRRPHKWNIRAVRSFMIVFGLISSAFDMLTFAVLLLVFHAAPELFRTGWFVESVLTELAIMMVIRTHRPFYRSTPGRLMLIATLIVMALTVALPFLPVGRIFDFVPLPAHLLAMVFGITILYVAASEIAKRWFYRHL